MAKTVKQIEYSIKLTDKKVNKLSDQLKFEKDNLVKFKKELSGIKSVKK